MKSIVLSSKQPMAEQSQMVLLEGAFQLALPTLPEVLTDNKLHVIIRIFRNQNTLFYPFRKRTPNIYRTYIVETKGEDLYKRILQGD